MDELEELCLRLAGDQAAARLMEQVGSEGGRTARITRALAAAREAAAAPAEVPAPPEVPAQPEVPATPGAPPPDGRGLAEAVADELASATVRLPPRQREVLALREYLGLTHAEIAQATAADQAAVVGLLAAARLRLQDELRGGRSERDGAGCPERDRALRTITRRQDAEQVTAADEDWLLEHLGHCVTCAQAHAAMLEASARYRAWPSRVRPESAAPDLSSHSTAG